MQTGSKTKATAELRAFGECQNAIKMLFIVYMIRSILSFFVNAIASSEHADGEVHVHRLLVLAELFIIF